MQAPHAPAHRPRIQSAVVVAGEARSGREDGDGGSGAGGSPYQNGSEGRGGGLGGASHSAARV